MELELLYECSGVSNIDSEFTITCITLVYGHMYMDALLALCHLARGVGWGGGVGQPPILYISYIKCYGRDQCKKKLFKK